MIKEFLILLTLFALTNCSDNDKSTDYSNNRDTIVQITLTPPPPTDEPPALPPKPNLDQKTNSKNKKIISVTDTLFLGDTLKIRFKTPHPKDLGIIDPDDKFFFLIYAYYEGLSPQLVDWDNFGNTNYLEIITNVTKANAWDAKIKESQLVFNKTGKYKIVLSENLETDDGTPVETKTIYYFNRQRTK